MNIQLQLKQDLHIKIANYEILKFQHLISYEKNMSWCILIY